MPESVLVSMPSSRLGAASYARSQSSRLYWTLISNSLWVALGRVRDEAFPLAGQDLLGRGVRDPVPEQAARQVGVAVEQVPRLRPRPLPDQVGGLVLEARGGAPAGLAALVQVRPVPLDRVEQLLHA